MWSKVLKRLRPSERKRLVNSPDCCLSVSFLLFFLTYHISRICIHSKPYITLVQQRKKWKENLENKLIHNSNYCIAKTVYPVTRILGHFYYRPQRSWAKVIFLHVSVILLTGGGLQFFRGGLQIFFFFSNFFFSNLFFLKFLLGCINPPPPPPRQSMRGRYASYWNAFLLINHIACKIS